MRETAKRVASAALFAVAVAGTVVATGAAPAAAIDASDTTTVHVEVSGAITLTDLTADFTLTGLPGATAGTTTNPVTMTVTTNNATGYTVTVQPATDALVGTGGNLDTIPTNLLQVRATGTGPFTALDPDLPVTVITTTARSAPDGDAVSNDYQIVIPFVATDTYSGTLNYIASTNL